MLPFVERIFAVYRANDVRQAARENWKDVDQDYVIHNGRGGPEWKMGDLIDELCDDVGLESSSHRMKLAMMTQHVEAGFDPFRAAKLMGNTIGSALKHYLVMQEENRPRLPSPDEATMTFVQLVNPRGELPPMPRAPVPPRPSAPPEGI
jgi:hypothetical protein